MRDKMDNWLIYTIIAIIGMTIAILLLKYLGNVIPAQTTMMFVLFIATFFMVIYNFKCNTLMLPNNNIIPILILCGFFSFIGNLFYMKALNASPNPGYFLALFDSKTIIITIASVFLFSSELSLINFIGIVIMLIGSRLVIL
jgi:uncharacterized membrane protein